MKIKTLSNTAVNTQEPITKRTNIQITDGNDTWYTPLTTPECIVAPDNTTFDGVTNLQGTNPLPGSTNIYSTLTFTSGSNGKTETVTLQGPMPDITIGDNGNGFINGNDSGKQASPTIKYEEINN